jgi:hypothetical protein
MGQTKASLVSVAACVATLLGTTGVLEAETIRRTATPTGR